MSDDSEELEERQVRDRIADRLTRAFSSVPKPAPPLTVGGSALADDVEDVLAGKDADALTADDARELRGDLRLLTRPALRYYLPALLRVVLLGEPYVDGLDEFTFNLLVPPEKPEQLRGFEEQLNLDAAQRAAIGAYVAWYSQGESFLPGRDRALAYWRT
ncbi:MAG: hypothetical protein JO286_11125 [Solirubrobacterales bacterium]|nr:hypothetical protein [Solirubrobacterales bacterium]